MIEQWKDVVGYEGLYKVSNMGKVYSYPKTWKAGFGATVGHKGKERKVSLGKNGYLNLLLNKDGKEKYHSVHRLVANAFIPNPNNLPVVNHIDENVTNNCVENLEWMTQKDNIMYSKQLESLREQK